MKCGAFKGCSIGATVCVLTVAALALLVQGARAADDFRLTIGSPIAGSIPATSGNPGIAKKVQMTTIFVVRVDGCPEPAKATIVGTAEGIVNGKRQSSSLTLNPMPAPGVYSVNRTWSTLGTWVVNLVATYQNVKAGAVIPVAFDSQLGSETFSRESAKFFSRPAKADEIDAVLKTQAAKAGSPGNR